MHYVPDTKGIRDAREKVTEIQEDIEIANLEKKKDLIQDEIDALEEQKDLIKDMIEESNKYYDNLIKNIEKSITELNKGADNAGKAVSNVGSSIGNLKKTLDTGKTLSYYIWTVQDEEVLANAKAGLENLNALLEKNPENYHYAQLKDDAASFVSELEKLKETRLVTDDFINSLNIFKNSEDEYLRLFQDALTGVEERVNNTANYSEKILGFVSPIADKTGELKQTLEKANEDVANLGSNTGDVVNGISTSVDGTNENINRMTGSVADAVMQVSRDSGLLNGSVTGISDAVMHTTESTSAGFNNLADNMSNTASSISQNADTVNNALDSISDSERFNNLAGSFSSLGEAILGVSTALGISEEGTVGGLVSAITAISEISLGGEEGGIIGQFHNLKTAIDEVSASIVGGSSEGTTSRGKSDSSVSANGGKGNKGAGSNSGSASSVTGSLEQLLQTADETLGSNGEEGEGGEGVIGKFGLLKAAVDLVTSAIGAGEEGSETEGSTLIGAITSQYATAEELIPQEKSLFEELLSSIEACVNALNGMKEAMSGMPGMGGISVSPHASGTVGNAFAKGYNGLPHDEKNALVSEYGQQEMTLLPNGKTILTDKPTMMDLPKDTVIFNEEQTNKIMDNKVDLSGNAYADGTDDEGWTTLADGTKIRPLQPGDKMYDMVQKFDAYFKSIDGNLEKLVPSSYYEHNRQMEEMTKQINYVSSITNNNRNMQPVISIGDVNVTCPGVTSQEVMREVGDALGKQIGHLSQRALQEAYKR